MMFPLCLQAGFWGLVGGSALLLGSAVGYYAKIPQRAMSSDKPLTRLRRSDGFWCRCANFSAIV
ncbi:hypothetical protein [Nostoc sp. LEGE 12447]|uniref:hypothetical protein n=1 Tax=Nostoc sp. LEGE 12447 TaxID=1828640 RepID=UPI001D149E0C|nr:hypothetical protein [Nostoc sp. LEGE 12447]